MINAVGSVISTETVTEVCAAFPAASVAMAVITLPPADGVIVAEKDEPVTLAGAPLTVTDAPDSTVPETGIEAELSLAPSAGDVIATAGGVVSNVKVTPAPGVSTCAALSEALDCN